MANIMTEAVSTSGRDIVEQVAAKGRSSGESHEQKEEGRYVRARQAWRKYSPTSTSKCGHAPDHGGLHRVVST